MIDRADQHHAVQHGDAEQRDEADRRGEIEVHAAHPERRDAADQREGYVADHQQRLLDGLER